MVRFDTGLCDEDHLQDLCGRIEDLNFMLLCGLYDSAGLIIVTVR
jgi:hypothetical protein